MKTPPSLTAVRPAPMRTSVFAPASFCRSIAKRAFCLFLFCLLAATSAHAQRIVSASVVDAETGEPLPYASVYVNPHLGTLTNGEGNFQLRVSASDTLRISYVGYQRQYISALKLNPVVRLKPLTKTMREVSVRALNPGRLVEEVIAQLEGDYKKWKGERELYFYRTVLSDDQNTQLLEAFMKANSAANLRKLAMISGVQGVDVEGEVTKLNVANTNIHQLVTIGARTHDTSRWMNCVKPFEKLKQTTQHYDMEVQCLGEGEEEIIKLQFTRKARRAPDLKGKNLMVGTAFLSGTNHRLLRFEGEVLNQFMRSGLSRVPEELKFCIEYDYSRGFAEVSHLSFEGGGEFTPNALSDLGKLHYRTVLFHVQQDSLRNAREYRLGDDLVSVIQRAGVDSDLWDKYDIIQRTDEEEVAAFGQSTVNAYALKKRKFPYRTHIDPTDNERLTQLIKHQARFAAFIPQEKVYVHMDNNCYFVGDTIWFSAYTRKTNVDRPSEVSRVLYVELLNHEGYLVERKLVYLDGGRGNGFFFLNSEQNYSGYYELRAYTRWQLNWGQTQHDHSLRASRWFISNEHEYNYYRDYEKLYSRTFPVYDRPKEPGAYERIMTTRPYRRPSYKKGTKPDINMTFYPEGGNLVSGLRSRVAVEVLTDDGQALEGELEYDGQRYPIVHRGRGIVELTASHDAVRDVIFIGKDGQRTKAKLPKAETSGAVLRVEQKDAKWVLRLQLTPDIDSTRVGISVSHEGKLYAFYAPGVKGNDAATREAWSVEFTPPTLSGIFQATVFTDEGQVLADRLFFNRNTEQEQPSLCIDGLRESYQPLERVELTVRSTDSTRMKDAVASVAVRESAYSQGNYDTGNILTEMLLSSELRGFIPNPGWYFEADDATHRQGLDLLMMTQGWRRFNWRELAVRNAWVQTQPKEKAPMLVGRVRKQHDADPRLMGQMYLSGDVRPEWDEDYDPFLGARGKKGQAEKIKQKAEHRYRYAKDDKTSPKGQRYVLHAVAKDSGGELPFQDMMTDNNGRFAAKMPSFYGDCYLFMAATEERKYTGTKQHTWKEMSDMLYLTPAELIKSEVAPSKNLVLIDRHYPRFVKPYTYYQHHLAPLAWGDTTFVAVDEGTTQMAQVNVKGSFGGAFQFSDEFPAFMIDAMEAENEVIDAGLYYSTDPVISLTLSDMGLDHLPAGMEGIENESRVYQPIQYRYGLTKVQRMVRFGDEISDDSLYLRRNLRSVNPSMLSEPELRDYRMGCIEKHVIYTDYSPRLEGDKRYLRDFPQTYVVSYPYANGLQRPIYCDRCFRLQGFAQPADFYSPDYSQRALPEGEKDYRRTLYWNPNVQLDANGEARITLYNNSTRSTLQVDAQGQATDGTLLFNKF